ncbi:MAG: ATP-binding cassette domain-containing protein [Candidatus Humimicrobiaceae bacterium]
MTNNLEIINLKGINKKFGAVNVLNNIDFYLKNGEIVALVGDNGAGKSTLIKILSGLYKQDKGEIWFEGKLTKWASPKDSRDAGIEVVYQDLALQELLSVTRNFFLGKELLKKGTQGLLRFIDLARMKSECIKALDQLGIHVKSVDQFVEVLSGGERQSIAIARSLYYGKKVLILDEPTAALSVKETRIVLELTKLAAKRGLGVIVISHNIMQVHSITDRIVVLFKGKIALNEMKTSVSVEEVTNAILTGSRN